MRVYTAAELRSYSVDVGPPPPRPVRKRLFRLRLWRPIRIRSPVCLPGHLAVEATVNEPIAPPTVPIRVDLDTSGRRQPKCKQLSMGTWNVRSLGNKFSSVSETITDRHLDLLAVVESWHRDSGDVSIRRAAPAGFRYIDEPRNEGRGGGLVVYFREHFKAKRIDINIQVTSFEYVVISLTTPSGPVTVVAIYRPGSAVPDANFFSEFTSILETLATFNSQLIIMGDLNVHLEDAMDGDCIKTKQLMESFSLIQHVDAPTHSAGGILDVVITRSDCDINNLIVDPPTISDHGLITCTVPYACPASPVFTSRRVRGWKKLDREEFRTVLSDGPLCQGEEYYAGMSASELFDLYSSTIKDTLDRLAPLHDITSRHNPYFPRWRPRWPPKIRF